MADKSISQGIGGSGRFGAHGSRNSGQSYPIGELMKLQTGVGMFEILGLRVPGGRTPLRSSRHRVVEEVIDKRTSARLSQGAAT